ncbi:MAG: PTS sugar transporter subunit IIB [Gemmatimonadota bacterium]|nr:MAG: PTS sugar transporter subunit IIB [Gemmatimonadota bacterium]
MPILLCRVDDRLIHGQVVVGWGAALGIDYVAVVDDDLFDSEWEQDLYRAGLSETIEARFLNVDEAAVSMPQWSQSQERGFVLTRDVRTMRRLADVGALDDQEVNLGGLHDAPGRRRLLPYLFLADGDVAELRRLQRSGVRVSAQDVPSARRVELDELFEMRSG